MPCISRCPRLAFLAAVALIGGGPTTALAQGVTGVVRDSVSAAPIPGVLVSVLDLDGARVRGALTDEAGRYAIEVPLGRYRIRAERIGLRPMTTEPFDVSTFNLHRQEVRMTDRAVRIAGLVVDGRVQSCRLDPEGAVRIQRWWQEIRTALDVSSVMQRQRFADFRVEKFEREWDPDLRRIIASNRRVEVATSSRPFVSEDADFLAEGGFVQGEITGQRQYYAPDADVLLSDVFLSQHCFSVIEDDDREGQLGLRFEPTRDRREADIHGTLWVDTTTAELQSLDFRYANVDGADEDESGGLVAFDYLSNGAWIVSEWYIRMPRLGVRERRGRSEYVVLGYVDVGGEVTPLGLGRETGAPGVEGAIRGTVYDSIRGVPVPDARVTILGTRLEALTDAAGQFVLTNVPVGRHNVTFFHADTEAWGLGSAFVEVEVEKSLTSVADLAIPGFRQAALALCLGEGVEAQTIVLGTALGPERQPIPNLPLEFSWTPSREVDHALPARTGSDGRFIVCTLPGEERITVRAERDGRWVEVFEVVAPMREITYREVWFTR